MYNVDEYITYHELVGLINSNSDIQVETVSHAGGKHVGIKLRYQNFPISINESEYNFMSDTIIKNDLKNGIEIATGVGISTLSLGMAFKQTGGSLITMDSYYEDIEQVSQNIPCGSYTQEQVEMVKSKAKTYQFVNQLLKKFSLDKTVLQCVGWSPTDSVRIVSEIPPLDFVFLDCPKSDEEFERDITSLAPHIGPKYAIFVHDTFVYTKKSFDLANKLFGRDMVWIHEFYKDTPYYSKRHFPLAVITNLEL